jgi:hypothetical protein
MAFALPAFVADPTLATGDLRLPPFAADPTALLTYTRLPAFVADGSSKSTFLLPPYSTVLGRIEAITASGAGSQSTASTARLELITGTGTGTQIPGGASHSVLALLSGSGAGTQGFPITLELITGTGTGVTGAVTTDDHQAIGPTISASGSVVEPRLSQATLQLFGASGTAISGVLAGSQATLELFTASGLGGGAASGSSVVTLPFILASGTAFLGTGATFSAVVVHTETRAVATYTNFLFNSFAVFNGQVLAAGDAGLFSLSGGTDDGAAINSTIRTGTTDYKSAFRKRVERVYLGYRSAAKMTLRVITDGTQVRDYEVPGNQEAGVHGARVTLGRGLEARYWQWEVRNRDGADFSLNVMDVKPIKLARRVGGRDA